MRTNKFFILRNYTVEHLFAQFDAKFSGYKDISIIDEEADIFVWFYTQPINPDMNITVSEIDQIGNYIDFVLERIPDNKTVLILTMTKLFNFKIIDSDNSVTEAIIRYNEKIKEISRSTTNIKVIDFYEFQLLCDHNIIDWKYFLISQMIVDPKLVSSFKTWFTTKLESSLLHRKKCLVLDLDNTLWGGVLGEDGPGGIQLGNSYPGNAYSYFQKAILELKKTGVLLAVCSKNNYSDLIELWDVNLNLILKLDDFTLIKANWDDKGKNIELIAKELNIGLDSLVFVDDNPRERELIRMALPEVVVPEFPAEPYGLLNFISNSLAILFNIYSLTDEDLDKSRQYELLIKRDKSKKSFVSYNDYLKSLEIVIKILCANHNNISRIAQMTQKTNQFNLTTFRYSEGEVSAMLKAGFFIRCFSVSDKFGDDGIAGLIIVKVDKDKISAEIDTFLLSCRILGKNIEKAILAWVCNNLRSQGVLTLKSRYLATSKNMQVADFYDKFGFELDTQNSNEKKYINDLVSDYPIDNYYSIIE